MQLILRISCKRRWGPANFHSGISMPLKVAKGASKAFAVAGAVLVAALLLESITMGEGETYRACPPAMMMRPLVWVGWSHLSLGSLQCGGSLSFATSLLCRGPTGRDSTNGFTHEEHLVPHGFASFPSGSANVAHSFLGCHRFGVRKAVADSCEFVPTTGLLLGFAVRFDPEVFANMFRAAG